MPAAMTSLLLTVQPVGSVVLAAIILSEAPSSLQLTGVALVMAGLVVATRPRLRRTPVRAAPLVDAESAT
jgi:drug/metabolite transporter (DMT)-like permease